MNTRTRRRRIARAVWAAGGRLEEVIERERVQPRTLRRLLADPEFRAMLAEEAVEPILQATSAVMRWAPAAVARLIRDLDSESASDARHAAREILRLAMDAPRKLGAASALVPDAEAAPAGPLPGAPGPDDPLMQSVARLTDSEVERIFSILTETEDKKGETP
ncbi:MAG TPA: hypothetical protein VMY35_00280 [Phycisphaerae bacterium]|nr:hypothetical protein [Phycisphaerae bacterium]